MSSAHSGREERSFLPTTRPLRHLQPRPSPVTPRALKSEKENPAGLGANQGQVQPEAGSRRKAIPSLEAAVSTFTKMLLYRRASQHRLHVAATQSPLGNRRQTPHRRL